MLQLAVLALLAQGPPAQPASTAPGTIEGVVVKAGTREPLAGARIQLNREIGDPFQRVQRQPPPGSGDPPPPPEDHFGATTGSDGRFVIENVPPGEYRLYATRTGGYVPAEYGQRSPTGRGIPFELMPGQKVTGIQLTLTPTGSITGHVYDRDGEPAGRAVVQALRPYYRDGTRTLTIVESVLTNDRGEYRLFWLPPGQYYVTAKSGDEPDSRPVRITEPARFVTFEQATSPAVRNRTLPTGEVVEETQVPVYYPGTTEATTAARIDLRSGGNADGIDIPIAAGPVRTRHVRGFVTNQMTGQPLALAQVLAVPRTSYPSVVVPNDLSKVDGSFDLAGVMPGSYFLFATTRGLAGAVSLQIGDRDVDNVAIAVTPGFRVSGRVIVDGESRDDGDPTGARRVNLHRDPDILGMPSAAPTFSFPSADGSFVLEGVSFGDFRVTVGRPERVQSLPQDMYVKSMRMGNQDVLENGLHLSGQPRDLLEIILGANGGRINGIVMNARREPLAGATVVAVPNASDRSKSDRYKKVASDTSGRFRLQGLAPGEYTVFAWDDIEEGAWQDPDVMRAYESRGTSVRVRDGNDENVQLTVITGR